MDTTFKVDAGTVPGPRMGGFAGGALALPARPAGLSALREKFTAARKRQVLTAIGDGVKDLWQRNFLKLQQRPASAFWRFDTARLRKRKKKKVLIGGLGATGRKSSGFYGKQAHDATFRRLEGTSSVRVGVNLAGIRLRLYGGTIGKKQCLPAIPDAVGIAPADWPTTLRFAPIHGPKTYGALVDAATGIVVYWLTRSTTHTADDAVIPRAETAAQIRVQTQRWLGRMGGAP